VNGNGGQVGRISARSSGETIVFPRAEMAAATEGILTDNGIP